MHLSKFKTLFFREPYLWKIKDQRYRTALSRLRLSSHNLAIETGRHARPKIPRSERVCDKCDTGSVEDEIHFIMACPKYSNSRETLFTAIEPYIRNFSTLPVKDKFKKIMLCNEPVCHLQLGRFIYEGFNGNSMQT